jgi:4-aminobutyrate aminotransferase
VSIPHEKSIALPRRASALMPLGVNSNFRYWGEGITPYAQRAQGGYVVPPAGLLSALREVRDRNGILLVADEIQSGMGRTGRWFAIEHEGVVPDILVMAKGIASGLPLAGLAARRELMQRWPPGSHGGTFGGNAVACAAAVATMQAMRDEKMLDNARRQGETLRTGLAKVQEHHPEIGEVRGRGLMVATEFGRAGGEPPTDLAKATVKAAFEEGLLLLTCGTYDSIIRWIPPLVVSTDQVHDALARFERALRRTTGRA